jgi:hypothetical protein
LNLLRSLRVPSQAKVYFVEIISGIMPPERMLVSGSRTLSPTGTLNSRQVLKAAAVIVGGLLIVPSVVEAQVLSKLYVSGGWAVGSRQNASIGDSSQHRHAVHAAIATIGVKLTGRMAIEGSVTWQQSQSFPWRFDYTFADITEERATERDTSVAAFLRFRPACRGAFCFEPFAGVGLNWHRGTTVSTARCNRTPTLQCSPIVDDDSIGSTRSELLFSGGVDFPMIVSRRVSLGPSVRVTYIRRNQFLFGQDTYGHRGPSNGSGLIPAIGFLVGWRTR